MTPRVWSFAGHGPGDQANCLNGDQPYGPRQTLRDKVTGLFPTCCFPGCSCPSQQCDVDHVKSFATGGSTCWCNLAPCCRFHHRLKTVGGWRSRFTEPGEPFPAGTVEWVSRLGQRFYRTPPVLPGANGWRLPVCDASAPGAVHGSSGCETDDVEDGLARMDALDDPPDATPEERQAIR